MKKLFSIIFCIFILICFLTSCKKNDNVEKISFSTWGSKSEISTIKFLINEFEKQNPNVKIDLLHIPDNYFQKLHLLIASNLSPDVIFVNNFNSQIYIDAKKFEPLNEYLENSEKISKNDFFPNAIKPLSKDNLIYAIPRDISNLVVYYNKDLFLENNIPLPSADWTILEFLDKAKKLTQDIDNDAKIDVWGFGFEENSLYWLPFLWSNGGGILSDDGKILLNTPESLDALQFYADLRNKYNVSPKVENQSSLTTSQLFLQKKVAMHLCGRWCSMTYKKQADFDWDIITFPVGKKGSIVDLDASGWAISSTSKNKDLAWKFIEFISSDYSINLMAQDGLILPAKKNVAFSEAFLSPPPNNSKYFISALDNAKNTPTCIKYNEIQDILNFELENLFNGNATAKNIIKNDLINKIEKLVQD